MRVTLRRRVILFGFFLIVVFFVFGAVAALDLQKAILGNNEELISLIKLPQGEQSATQREQRQAEYHTLEKTLVNIASNNSTVRNITEGKNYSVVGIGVDRGGTSQGPNVVGAAQLVINVDGTYYTVSENVQQQQVTAVNKRACYGPECNR